MTELQCSVLPTDGECLVFLCPAPESTVYKQWLDMTQLQWSVLPIDGECLVFLCPESTVYEQWLDMTE